MMAGVIGGEIGYRILKAIGRHDTNDCAAAYLNRCKMEVMLGSDFWEKIKDKVVIDFGCGNGDEAIEMAKHGATRVIGLDIRIEALELGRKRAAADGVAHIVTFSDSTDESADIIVSLDAFEHFDDPASILVKMRSLLRNDGLLIAAFGPTWYHPLGGHLFSVFPYAHLVFTENALIRWRSEFKTDGATRFSEVAGGLNQMTISRFERIIEESQFDIVSLETVPIKKLKRLASRLTREFTTSIVRCVLRPSQ